MLSKRLLRTIHGSHKTAWSSGNYTSSTIGIAIVFEFLAAGGGFVSASKDPQPTSLGGFIPSLGELGSHEGSCLQQPLRAKRSQRSCVHSSQDFKGMQFENLDEEDKEVLYELAQPADQVDGDLISRLLASMEENLSIKVHLKGPQVPNLYFNSEKPEFNHTALHHISGSI